MKNKQGSTGLLLLFDSIGLLCTTVAFMIVFSKLTNVLDSNTIIISLFFFGIKLLFIGIADISGIGRSIVIGVLFILIANVILLGINLVMVFGISNKALLISAGADLVVILLIRLIQNSINRNKTGNAQTDSPEQFADDDFEADTENFSAVNKADLSENAGDFYAVNPSNQSSEIPSSEDEMPSVREGDYLNDGAIGSELETLDQSEDEEELIDPAFFEDPALSKADPFSREEANIPLTEAGSGPFYSDLPNLNNLDAFFDDLSENKLQQDDADSVSRDVAKGGGTTDSLSQEMSRQIEELHQRIDDLENREAALKKREAALNWSWKKQVEILPNEVVLDDDESEIIIDEDDLAILKNYLRNHPEI